MAAEQITAWLVPTYLLKILLQPSVSPTTQYPLNVFQDLAVVPWAYHQCLDTSSAAKPGVSLPKTNF